MSELQNILEESVARVFEDNVDNQFLTSVEETGWPLELWNTLTELGLSQILASEAAGGMGGSWADAYVVVRRCGYASLPLPVPEAILATWLCKEAAIELPVGVPGLIPQVLTSGLIRGDSLSGEIARIPWGRNANYYLGITDASELIVLGQDGIDIVTEDNLGRDPRDTVSFRNTQILNRAPANLPTGGVQWLCAMLRSAQIAGASARCLEIGIDFVGDREQFGRPLSRFQAIQHHLAVMVGAVATVESMSANAFRAMDQYGISGGPSERDAKFEIAAAKCRASDSVEAVTRIGHQVHGAIGFTYEYGLHFLTRRLWAWRAEFGGSGKWAQYLGEVAKTQGGDNIWAYITN
ncbi:MAG: acyl-CoA dehydrogenase [Gammaproteobacteria bacterium]|jgi:acyl-CoA dehydrogenase